jgi:hypothetical protein
MKKNAAFTHKLQFLMKKSRFSYRFRGKGQAVSRLFKRVLDRQDLRVSQSSQL